MSELFKGFCPECAAPVNWDKGAAEATCEYCGYTGSVSKFGESDNAEAAMPVITGFDNPESGVVFIENFFDTYNWEVWQKTTEIEIKAIAEVIRNNKMKNCYCNRIRNLNYFRFDYMLQEQEEVVK